MLITTHQRFAVSRPYLSPKIPISLSEALNDPFVTRVFDMDKYICAIRDLPDIIYRVDYPGSRTTFSTQEGFVAADTNKVFGANELNDFKRAIEGHFTWSHRASSPFISLFSDREHAENWACKEPWRENNGSRGGWALYVIDMDGLKNMTSFFKLNDLVERLNLDIPEGAQQHMQGAFVCLHHIPATAIVDKRTPAEVEEGKCSDANFK
jgi:hypothetical protein